MHRTVTEKYDSFKNWKNVAMDFARILITNFDTAEIYCVRR